MCKKSAGAGRREKKYRLLLAFCPSSGPKHRRSADPGARTSHQRRERGGNLRWMGRRNPLPSFHPQDRQSYVDLIRAACGCSKPTAGRIASAFPDAIGLDTATPASFRRFGATDAQADRLVAAFELARMARTVSGRRHGAARTPHDVVRYLLRVIGPAEQELFVAVYLDSRQKIIDVREVGRGSLAAVDVHPRELFRDAVRTRAHSVILAHNHPSGDAEPSEADVELTRRMVEVGRLVGIPVLDHLVITPEDYSSLSALGLMPKP